MVVMAIIAVLATAGISAYTGYLKGARDSARITKARQLKTIVEALVTVNGVPTPTQLTDYLSAERVAWKSISDDSLLAHIYKFTESVL